MTFTFESFLHLILSVGLFDLHGHHGEELGEVDRPVAVGVHLVDHVLQLGLGRVLSERAHHRSQFLRRDRAVAVLVKKRKCFFEFCKKYTQKVLMKMFGGFTKGSSIPEI